MATTLCLPVPLMATGKSSPLAAGNLWERLLKLEAAASYNVSEVCECSYSQITDTIPGNMYIVLFVCSTEFYHFQCMLVEQDSLCDMTCSYSVFLHTLVHSSLILMIRV